MAESGRTVGDAQINAARTKIIIDKKLGRPSSANVKHIAAQSTSSEHRAC